jgi:hypothetical protein
VKRTGRGESIVAVIHICMGTTQGISLCSDLYLKVAKHHVFHFSYYVFSSIKSENRRAEQVLPREEWVAGTSGRGEVIGKGVGGCICCKQCIHVYVNAKMIPVETSRNLGRVDGKEKRRGGFKYDIFDTL